MTRAVLIVGLLSLAVAARGQECSLRLELPSRYTNAEKLAHLPGAPVPGLYASDLYVWEGPILDLLSFARWDGAAWAAPGRYPSLLAAGQPYPLQDLCVFDDGTGPAIYTCGLFTHNELGEVARGVARWTGDKWVEVGGGVFGQCYVLEVYDDGRGPALYVGGRISEAGGRPVSNIAKWNGDAWSDVGGGVWSGGPAPVSSMCVFDDGSGPALFVGGQLTQAGGQHTIGVAKWTGSDWEAVAPGPSWAQAWVQSMAVHDDGSGPALYVGGSFGSFPGVSGFAQGIVRWDGERWTNVGATTGSLSADVNTLAVFDDGSGPQLYAGGRLTEWFGRRAGLARWDGVEWTEVRHEGRPIVTGTMTEYDDGSGAALWFYGALDVEHIIGRLRCVSDPCDFADCDLSGRLDFFDYLCFQNAFAAADTEADCDGDGDLTFLDFLCFQNHFVAGCP